MSFRRAAMALLAVALLLGAGLAIWYWRSATRLYSSPTAVRTNDTYLRAHGPATNMPPVPPHLFEGISIEHTAEKLTVRWPGVTTREAEYEPLEVHQADSNHVVRIGEGSIRLAYVATGYEMPGLTQGWGTEIEPKFFNANLEPIAGTNATEVTSGYRTTLYYSGDYPMARFYFLSSNIAGLKPQKFAVFDARTTRSLTSGYSSSQDGRQFWFQNEIKLWHQTPIQLVVTVSTGPAETYTITPAPGAEIATPGGTIRVLKVLEADLNNWSSRGDRGTNIMTFRLGSRTASAEPRTSVLCYAWPSGQNFRFSFHDESGAKTFNSTGESSSGGLIVTTLHARPEELKQMRITFFPKSHRMIFLLPELPGLPERNRGVANLFDVYVPGIKFSYEHEFQNVLSEVLQMEVQHLPLVYSNVFFPTIRSNFTVRQHFAEIASMLPDSKQQVLVDPETNRIELKPHPFWTLLDKLKKRMGMP
jgi:hypothetical protein